MLKVQELLAVAGEHIEGAGEEGAGWKAAHQSAAVLGLVRNVCFV